MANILETYRGTEIGFCSNCNAYVFSSKDAVRKHRSRNRCNLTIGKNTRHPFHFELPLISMKNATFRVIKVCCGCGKKQLKGNSLCCGIGFVNGREAQTLGQRRNILVGFESKIIEKLVETFQSIDTKETEALKAYSEFKKMSEKVITEKISPGNTLFDNDAIDALPVIPRRSNNPAQNYYMLGLVLHPETGEELYHEFQLLNPPATDLEFQVKDFFDNLTKKVDKIIGVTGSDVLTKLTGMEFSISRFYILTLHSS